MITILYVLAAEILNVDTVIYMRDFYTFSFISYVE